MSDTSRSVHAPMILKMERICRGYIDQLEKPDGKEFVFQNFMMMYIFGACMNTEYRTKLFDHWPSYLEDFSGEVGKKIMGYRYPDNLVETFAKLNLDKDVKIIDIASGPGNVPYFLKNHGYTNVDGLDPSQGLLDQGTKRGLFKKAYCCYVTPDEKTPIEDNTYDVMLCSAGMFPGSIVPQAFKELIRIVKPGGILAWNIADGYEGFNDFFLSYDKIIKEHIANGDWEEVQPARKDENMLFEDAAYTHVMRKLKK